MRYVLLSCVVSCDSNVCFCMCEGTQSIHAYMHVHARSCKQANIEAIYFAYPFALQIAKIKLAKIAPKMEFAPKLSPFHVN